MCSPSPRRMFAWSLVCALLGSFPLLRAAQSPPPPEIYTTAQSGRGQALYADRCAACHGKALEGGLAPALAGTDFDAVWAGRPLWDFVSKIQNTMPADDSGKLTATQVADIVAFLLQSARFPPGRTEFAARQDALKDLAFPAATVKTAIAPVASHASSFPAAGNLAELMRGVLFPSSNLIFNVQSNDPATPITPGVVGAGATTAFSWMDWGAGIYKGWEIVDYAAVAIAESAPLMLTPGRRCENGKPVPVDRPDWIKFTQELYDAGVAARKASQTRNQEAVSEASNQLADSCLHCHEVYRDKPGGTVADPSNKAARCVP
jgi:mono/diheme cytochrome c family protein